VVSELVGVGVVKSSRWAVYIGFVIVHVGVSFHCKISMSCEEVSVPGRALGLVLGKLLLVAIVVCKLHRVFCHVFLWLHHSCERLEVWSCVPWI